MKGVIIIDVEKCQACKSCELECSVAHSAAKDLLKAVRDGSLPQSRIKVEKRGEVSVPVQCRHCKDAPCIASCKKKIALVRESDEDPVLLIDELCIGCKLCIKACPYGAIKMETGVKKIVKCDLCIERQKKGEKPACVMACPTGAITFKTLEEFKKESGLKEVEFLVQIKENKKGIK